MTLRSYYEPKLHIYFSKCYHTRFIIKMGSAPLVKAVTSTNEPRQINLYSFILAEFLFSIGAQSSRNHFTNRPLLNSCLRHFFTALDINHEVNRQTNHGVMSVEANVNVKHFKDMSYVNRLTV